MRSYLLSIVALVTLLLAGSVTTQASAQGFHFGGGGVHIDVGNPHNYYGNYGGYYGGWNGSGCGYGGYPSTTYYGSTAGYGGWGGGHAHWHDTTHLDFHAGEFVRHRNHVHYVPGHYDVHEDGHWDYHD
ncbi:MAG: hypothetical protein AB7G28_08055 [Pirellulales bacterium]